MQDVLIYGDLRSPQLRHELPLTFTEPIAYVEYSGRRHAFVGSLEVAAVRGYGGVEVTSLEELGLNEFLQRGMSLAAAAQNAVAKGCERIGLRTAVTPSDFPLEFAELLRSRGFELSADSKLFEMRRRRKSAAELEGVRRAQRTGEAAMAVIRERIGSWEPVNSEELRALARLVFAERDAAPHDRLIIACGSQCAQPHEAGSGPIRPYEPIIVDIFARDIASGCWGDLTRTFCLGEPPERLRRCHEDVREACRLATAAVAPGVTGEELTQIAAGHLADQGHPTRLELPAGTVLEEGFVHTVGHGVGLELIEEPILDMGTGPLVVGDVVTIEPGVYYEGFGGVRVEDLVLVTEDGHELLTQCPYELEISAEVLGSDE